MTVKELIIKVGLNPFMIRKVKWGTLIDTQEEGVYIIYGAQNETYIED